MGLGVLDVEHEWFRNYLQNRTQIVEFQGVSGAAKPVSVGVPQGSILGLLLFILHLNDLPSAVVECSILMYADDTVVFFAAPEVSTMQATLEKFPSILLFFRRIFPPEVFPFTPLRPCGS